MKKILFAVVSTILFVACHDSKDNAAQKLPKRFDSSVGGQIPLNLAYSWVKNFGGSITTGREQSPYSFSAATLSQFLVASEGPGIVFHHATDENHVHHILMCSIADDGSLFQSDILDLSAGVLVDATTAERWAKRYADAHATTPWYHFFGNDIFEEILSNEAFEYVNVVRALSDDDQEQVLLFVYNTGEISGGRSEGQDVTVYDISSPCPPCSIN